MSASSALAVRVEWLGPAHLASWRALFETEASPCFCRYWHFEGDKNAWLLRCAESPLDNFEEARRDLDEGAPRARGLVALDERGEVVGWMKLAPRAALPKLRRLPTYRAHDLGDDEGVWSIGCFLVRESARLHGVARALVAGALRLAKEAGARAVEAYPRDGVHAAESWTGPSAVFADFTHVAGEAPYPVLRKTL